MKILKLQYILILAVLTACQDESFQVPMEENEVHIATENEILLKRGYSDYTLTAERLAGLEGCRIRAKEAFCIPVRFHHTERRATHHRSGAKSLSRGTLR